MTMNQMGTQGQGHEKPELEQLNSFLRGEISAVETYAQALNKIKDTNIKTKLQENQRSHQQRVQLLTDQVRKLGGTPVSSSGVWGSFAKLVQGGADLFGDKTAVAALEEGEDHGLRDYRSDTVQKLGTEVRSFVQQQILPAAQQTHQVASTLKHTMEMQKSS
jgi:uncharacterized protein (TIGR02284 family)